MAIDLDQDIYGSSQSDVLNGGAGNERMFGGAGNDTMNGGAGSDSLNGGSGDDTLVYNLSANGAAGTSDVYMGGSGKDTLWLQFTRAEWLTHQVQSQLAAYLAHLAAVTNPTTGEVSNGTASDFVFTFGGSSLTVQMLERVRVSVDGVELTAGDDPVTAVADTGSMLEDGPAVNISVLANDTVPDLVATLALASAPAHGSATLVQPDPNDPSTWYFQYQANAADFQYLAKDQTATDSFSYTVTDANGTTGTATVVVTIKGTNDAPVVAAADVTGGITELVTPSGNLSDSGTISFTDVDLTDVHSVGVVTASAGALGTLTASVTSDTTGSGSGGVVTWNYSVSAAAAEYLAAGQTKTETFSFDVSDGQGGSVTRTVSVTLTGTNDGPVVAAEDVTGGVTEMGTPSGNLTDSGTIAFTDVDLADVHSVSAVTASAGSLGTMTASVTADTTGTGSGGVVTWNYSVAATAAEYLAEGQTKTETFSFDVSDGQGGTVTRTVSVTLTGTNDGPIVAAEDVTGGVTEMGTAVGNLTDTGTISFTDVDLTDAHSVGAVTASAGALGTLTASVTSDTTGSGGGGVVTWNYSVAATAAEYLAEGQTKTETFSFDVSDGQGGTVPRTVSVTLTGTNDGPLVAAEDVTGGVTEMGTPSGNLTDSGTIAFTDVDLTDVHSVGVVTASAGALGTLTAGVTSDTTGSGSGGVVTWNYSVAATAAEYLAEGQTKTETFSFDVSDGQGGTVTRTVGVTLTGTNDATTITSGAQAAALTEIADHAAGENTTTHNAAGTITFADADVLDAHTATVTPAGGGYLGSFTLGSMNDAADSLGWNFSVADGALDSLRGGQVVTQQYQVAVNDGHGSTASQTVTVTLTGTNDAPVIAGQTTGAVTEDSATSASGTLTISDPDALESSFQAQSGVAGTYGTLNINAAGNWTYFLNNSLPAVQALNSGQTLSDTVNVLTADGTSQAIGITINGANEAGGFMGKQLTYQYLFPNAGAPYAASLSFTTGSGIEVVNNWTNWTSYYANGFNVDVSATRIVVTYVNPVGWNYGSFNGFRLSDVVNNVHDITGVTDNSAKAVTTFDANDIYVNWQGQNFYAGESITIDVVFGPGGSDPIVLDLDGDGFSFATGSDSAHFDLNVDGTAEATAWVDGQDGLLVADLDGSGTIQDGKELLSENFAGFGFGNSMEALRSLDTNVDGVVDRNDASFSTLLVWRDGNGDGVSQAGELLTLASLGITGISVQEQAQDATIDGQHVYAAGTFLYRDGTAGHYVGVQLQAASAVPDVVADEVTIVGSSSSPAVM